MFDRRVLQRGGLAVLAILPSVLLLFVGEPRFALFYLGLLLCLMAAIFFPTMLFFAAMITAPMIGVLFSIPIQHTQFGEQVFAGSIDVPLADTVAFVALFSICLWIWRQHEWRWAWRILPLKRAYGALVVAHAASLFSSADPNRYEVIKYALRPVGFSYLASIALPVLFIRTVKLLRFTLGWLVAVGMVFAVDGTLSLFVGQGWLPLAHPLPWGGIYLIGMNHNVLAELLIVTAPFAFALAKLTHDTRARHWLYGMAGFMAVVALLTFARSAWIVLTLQLAALSLTVWRERAKRLWRYYWGWILVCLAPMVAYMAIFSSQAEVQGSTETRATLTGIAWQLFIEHPLFGVGAGTFFTHVANTWAFQLSFGAPLDAHGILQKLIAETGILGLAVFAVLWFTIVSVLGKTIHRLGWQTRIGQAMVFLSVAVLGAVTYQLFNTTYWTAKLWLPVGIAFAARRLFLSEPSVTHV